MRRAVSFRIVAGCLILAAGLAAAAARPIGIERRIVHPNGASIVLHAIDLGADSVTLSATIANPGKREISLNRAGSFVLEDGAHGIHHLNPPFDDAELRIPAHTQIDADLVFVGPLAPSAREVALSINEGIGTPDNPYDNVPVFHATLPLGDAAAAPGEYQANHPDGATLRVRRLAAGPDGCLLSLRATNGNARTIVLNQRHGMVLTDGRGVAAPVKAPAENAELVVPPSDRLEAELVFDCRALDTGGALTLVTNRGAAGTTDNPYDTLPVFSLRLAVERLAAGSPIPSSSHAAAAPLARSRLSSAEPTPSAAAAAPVPASPIPAASRPAPSVGVVAVVPPPAPPPATKPAAKTVPQLEAALHAAKGARGLRIVLPADALFGATGTDLDSRADPQLAILAELIAATHPKTIVVAGHTDSSGSDDANLALSKERAAAVAAWLAAHLAQRPPHFVEQGYGRTRPAAPNHNADGSDNPAGRALNRRIEITLRR